MKRLQISCSCRSARSLRSSAGDRREALVDTVRTVAHVCHLSSVIR